MKALLVGEYREGKLQDNIYELVAFAGKLGADVSMALVGDAANVPRCNGTLHLADVPNTANTIRVCTGT